MKILILCQVQNKIVRNATNTRCNFSGNLQRNSTLKRCKFVTNVWYVKNILENRDGNMYLPISHLPKVELLCELQEKLHRVTERLLLSVAKFPSKFHIDRTY